MNVTDLDSLKLDAVKCVYSLENAGCFLLQLRLSVILRVLKSAATVHYSLLAFIVYSGKMSLLLTACRVRIQQSREDASRT